MLNLPAILKHDGTSHSLPRRRIIRHRTWIDMAFRSGRRRSNRWLTLIALEKTGATRGEVAFLTPKRLGPAVVRNRVRRLLREVYRTQFNPEEQMKGWIWLAKGPSASADFDTLKNAMIELKSGSS